jgi:hypothetical protein
MDSSVVDGTQATIPAAEEVKWQVAFFALIPLILTAMTQPVGRVLGKAESNRFWMRSSPSLCIADMILFLAQLLDRFIRKPGGWRTLWDHLKISVADRYRVDREEDQGETGSSSIEASTMPTRGDNAALIRWLVLLLGGVIMQTIKLTAMQGIPLTKTLALLYFIAIAFGEVVALSAAMATTYEVVDATSRPSWLTTAEEIVSPLVEEVDLCLVIMVPGSLWARMNVYLLSRGMVFVSFLPVILATCVCWFLFRLWRGDVNSLFSPRRRQDRLSLQYHLFWIVTAGVCALRGLSEFLASDVDDAKIGQGLLGLLRSFLIMISILQLAIFAVWMVQLAIVCGVSISVRGIARTRLGHRLGFPKSPACQGSMTTFFVKLLALIVYYAFLFDGAGTVNPTWTSVFG